MDDKDYMKLALDQAKLAYGQDEVPVGAIVVDFSNQENPEIVSKAYNMREKLNDPSAHAEFLAIQKASQKLETWRLSNCVVYVTLEPCIMCAGLMQQARIKRCVYGADDPKCGAMKSLYKINQDTRLNHNFDVASGILKDECSALLKEFFKAKR